MENQNGNDPGRYAHMLDQSSIIQGKGDKNTIKCTIEETEEVEYQNQWLQYAAALSANLSLMACGAYEGWTSPTLPYLETEESGFGLSKDESGWVASLYTIGAIAGAILIPLIINRMGRKWSLLTSAVPLLVGWILIILAKSYITLYVARCFAGVGHGGIYSAAVIYNTEIADSNIRGVIGSFLKMSSNLGFLFSVVCGAYLDYDIFNFVSLILPIAFIVTFFFMPETPYFHLIRNHKKKAVSTLMRLRNLKNESSVEDDVRAMNESLETSRKTEKHQLLELINTKGNRRSLAILVCLIWTQQFSGNMAITSYAEQIFDLSGSSLGAKEGVIVLGVAQLAAGCVSSVLADRAGRRILIILSGLLCAFFLSLVGVFVYLKNNLQSDVSSITWLPITALILFQITLAVGLGSIPYVLLGEIFPTNVRGTAVSIGIVLGTTFASIVTKGYKHFLRDDTIAIIFWFFAACLVVGTLIGFIITPETKGKTLEEIQMILNSKEKKEQCCHGANVEAGDESVHD